MPQRPQHNPSAKARPGTHATLALASAAVLTLLAGCVSLDSKPDIRRAADAVHVRTGIAVPWDEPWAKDTTWDGRSPLQVDQAVLAALTNSGEIRALVEQVAAGRADLAQAGLLPNPVVSISVRVPLDGGPVVSPVGVSVTQSFVALWLRGPRRKAADARLNQSILTLSDSALTLVADVRTAHARIVFGQRALELARANLDRCKAALNAVRLRVESGHQSTLDLDRVGLAALAADWDLERRRMALDRQRRELLLLMGLAGVSDDWSAQDPSPGSPDPDGYPPLLPDSLTDKGVVDLALAQRLDVAASLAVVEANKKDLSTQERSRIRDLGVGLVVQQTQEELRFLGLENSIPLFDFNQAQIAKAGSLGRAALARAESVFQRAIMESRVALGDATVSRSIAHGYRRDVLAAARENFDHALSPGGRESLDVSTLLDTLSTLAASEQSANELDLRAVAARIELERALGGSLIPLAAPASPRAPNNAPSPPPSP